MNNNKRISECFGELVFDKKKMKERLSTTVYEKLMATIEEDAPLEYEIAYDVAHAMKEWAIENGATHFTHWFQPQRGGTAEKHDSFIGYDDNGDIIEKFSAKQLIQSEPDASSFPSGGIRSTFEARGYTAWDPTSPAFLIKGEDSTTLVIPSVYLSWTGEVLDIKTPFLRSLKALKESGLRIQKLLGNRMAKTIKVFTGPEQEYFLVSKELYDKRIDLQVCGKTLFGSPAIKGQQMEDHYFGAIKDKVLSFMEDLDYELYKRGIPAKTRHNEVSPNQFEIAPLYEDANLSIDHNLQLMDIMKRVAEKHGLVALLTEKPFKGVNGSGKHLNWSIGDNTGANYLEPSKSPLKNITFLITIAAILKGVEKFGGLLRASIADANNDYRLGANEAPPAIMSVYLGEYLDGILNEIEGVSTFTPNKIAHINLGIQNLPKISKDISDRNRTSPIAFTGNKFEFRAVGSSQNCAEPTTILNLMLAYGYDYIYEKLIKMEGDVKTNVYKVIKDVIKETKHVRFEGNNYSEEWHKEAERRGLPNAKNTPAALEYYLKPEAIELFEKYKVLSKRELESKIEIKLETYIKTKEIDYKTAIYITKTMILPAVLKYINEISTTLLNMKNIGINSETILNDLKSTETLYKNIKESLANFEKVFSECFSETDNTKKAKLIAEKLENSLAVLRDSVDKAEIVMPRNLWPLPSYQELLTKL